MLKAFSMTLLGATFMTLLTLPAQALEVGPVQVILQPRVIVAPEPAPRRVVVVHEPEYRPVVVREPEYRPVVVREPEYQPVVERRVIVVRKHGRHWDRDRYERDGWGHEPERREVIVVRR